MKKTVDVCFYTLDAGYIHILIITMASRYHLLMFSNHNIHIGLGSLSMIMIVYPHFQYFLTEFLSY